MRGTSKLGSASPSNWLFDQLNRINTLVDSQGNFSTSIRRLLFMCYEADTVLRNQPTMRLKVEALTDIIFESFGFKVVEKGPLENTAFHSAFVMKTGVPITVSLLYRFLAEHTGLHAKLLNSPDFSIIKFQDNLETIYLDIKRKGRILDKQEILQMCQNLPSSSSEFLEPLTDKQFLVAYMKKLIGAAQQGPFSDSVIKLIQLYQHFNPQDFSILKQRALYYWKNGDRTKALQDIKRYLNFISPKQPETNIEEFLRRNLEH